MWGAGNIDDVTAWAAAGVIEPDFSTARPVESHLAKLQALSVPCLGMREVGGEREDFVG